MSAQTLLLDALFLLATALIYGHVGRVIMRRRVPGDAALAGALFGVFWMALGGLQLIGASQRALAAAGVLDVASAVTLSYIALLVLCGALWALNYYLFYLFTGTRRILVPLTVGYVAFYAALVYLVTYAGPTGLDVGASRVRIVYERDLAGTPAALAVGLLLLLPPLVGAAAYARLFFKVEGATQRYRIGLVSATLLVWFGASLVATIADLGAAPWWQLASRVMGLGAALLILAAYRPPGWVRRRWGVRSIDEPTSA